MGLKETHEVRDFYRAEALSYHRDRYQTRYGHLFARLHHEQLEACLKNIIRHGKVLEIACGTGHTTELLAGLGFQVIACDLTPEMMLQAQNRCQEIPDKPCFIQTNAQLLPFPDTCFDVVIATRFMHLFPPHKQVPLLKEMVRVLKSGGMLILDFDNKMSRWIFALPYLLYNIFKYRRLVADTHYNLPKSTCDLLRSVGMRPTTVYGLGGTHLVLMTLISREWALRFGRLHGRLPLRWLAEQFIVTSIKS